MSTTTEINKDAASPANDIEIQTNEVNECAPAGACIPHYCPADANWVAAFHEDFVMATENINPGS
jgi:hypothetical protein